MDKKQAIEQLQKIAKDLDKIGSYREAENVDNILIKIAQLSDEGAKAVIEPHPSKKYVRRHLGIPPQNIIESLQNKIDELIGKLKKSKTIDNEKLTNEFINSIFQQYQTKGYVNSAFVDFIAKSAKFVEELHNIITNNPEQQKIWKKLFQDIRFTIDRTVYFEVKKLNNKTIEESKNKTDIYETITSLLKLEDFFPRELISTIKAYKEFLDGRSELEQHFQSIAEIGEMQPNAEIIAEQELKNYSEDSENRIQKLLKSSVPGKNMNNRHIVASLNKIANQLDINGLYKESNSITMIMKRLAQDNTDTYNRRFQEDEDYTELVMNHLFGVLWSITPWKLNKEDHPINKFSGSEKIRFVFKKMRDIYESDAYATPGQLRSIVGVYQDFLKMFINSEYISRAGNEKITEKLNNFLMLLNQAEQALNEDKAEEFYNSLPDKNT